MIKSIAVYCASSMGNCNDFAVFATKLGEQIAIRNKTLIYGGAKVGLMGTIADAVLQHNGTVKGVIPEFLKQKELQHDHLSETFVVDTMHERKAKMIELADAFIAMPGGFGTMEELFEVLTWSQLAIHHKPIALLNVNGFYDKLLEFIDVMCEQKLIKPEHRDMIIVSDNPQYILDAFESYTPTIKDKWYKPIQ